MTIIADPEERQALEALCDWLATKCAWPPHEAPAQNAHTILQDALTKPEKSDGLREALRELVDAGNAMTHASDHLPGDKQRRLWNARVEAAKILDADSCRRNTEANKPAFPNGRFASREKGGV